MGVFLFASCYWQLLVYKKKVYIFFSNKIDQSSDDNCLHAPCGLSTAKFSLKSPDILRETALASWHLQSTRPISLGICWSWATNSTAATILGLMAGTCEPCATSVRTHSALLIHVRWPRDSLMPHLVAGCIVRHSCDFPWVMEVSRYMHASKDRSS